MAKPARTASRRDAPLHPQPPPALTVRRFQVDGTEMAILSFPIDADGGRTPLTPAEHAIVDAILAGKRNADIARERGTATRTIANQVASIYRKLGVRSRAELVAQAALLGGRNIVDGA
jgi:DNA-binding CsgD family transcriptional regulator